MSHSTIVSLALITMFVVFTILYLAENLEKSYFVSYVVLKSDMVTYGNSVVCKRGLFMGKLKPEDIATLEAREIFYHEVDNCILLNVLDLGYSLVHDRNKKKQNNKKQENKTKRGPRLMK